MVATPVLVDATGRQLENEDIRVFVDRQGIPKLAAALHYTLRVVNGEMTQRTVANKLDVHPVEGTTVNSVIKRSDGSASRARVWYRQFREITLVAAVYNVERAIKQ